MKKDSQHNDQKVKKDSQHNDQKVKKDSQHNDQKEEQLSQNTTQKSNDWATQTPLKRGRVNSGGMDRLVVTVNIFSMFFSVFKIYTIDDDDFTEKFNLRVGRSLNLNFSASDVAWSHIEGKKIYMLYNCQLSFKIWNMRL